MHFQDPEALLALHRADHRDLVADAQSIRARRERSGHRPSRARRLRRAARRAYLRSLRRLRFARRAPALSSRVAP